MKMVEIKCDKCGKTFEVNAELTKCMCQYCGNEIDFTKTAGGNMTYASADDANEVAKYKNMLRMDIIVSVAAFIGRFIFKWSIIISFAVIMLLILLPLRDADKMLKKKDMMQRNGMQRGNIIGVAVLVLIDILLWVLLLVHQFGELVH